MMTPSPLALERQLPSSRDAEQAVIGAMLLDPEEAAAIVRNRLALESFYFAGHQVIFREICALQDAHSAVDIITLSQRLFDRGLLEDAGGAAYLTDCLSRVPTTANVEHYIDIVADKALCRRVIDAGHGMIQAGLDRQDDVRTWIDTVEQQVFGLNTDSAIVGPQAIRAFVKGAMTSIETMLTNQNGVTGLATGFRELDGLTAGLQNGNMIIIAARPSMGKTALAMNIAENVALDQGLPVGVFSLEMSSDELTKRVLSSRARVNMRALRFGMTQRDGQRLAETAGELMRAPLFIDDTAALTINQVRARARRMARQHGIRLLMIDYMQLMRSDARHKEQNRQVEVAEISTGVKALAKELNIPVIVLSQLNRQPEARSDGKPRLSDLRESGSMEQDADVVSLLIRPEVYEDDVTQKESLKGQAVLTIAKQRNGPTGDIQLTFRHEFTRFENFVKVQPDDVSRMHRSRAVAGKD